MAAPTESTFIQTAPRHLQAVLRNERVLTRWVSKENFQRNKVAYRAIDLNISDAGGCVLDVGLFSRERGDENNPWRRELIVHHLTDGKGRHEVSDHRALPSPYMSISTSPQKIVNFIRQRINQKEVAIIDVDMLKIMGVRYRSTTDLEVEFRFRTAEDGMTYTTDTHYLVYEHIPQCCILGFIPGQAFADIWAEKLRKIRQNPDHQGPEELDWHTDLEGNDNLRETSIFSKNPLFERQPPAPEAMTPTTNGRFQRTINTLGSTNLNTVSPRKRGRSPESSMKMKAEEDGNDFGNARRTLWPGNSSAQRL